MTLKSSRTGSTRISRMRWLENWTRNLRIKVFWTFWNIFQNNVKFTTKAACALCYSICSKLAIRLFWRVTAVVTLLSSFGLLFFAPSKARFSLVKSDRAVKTGCAWVLIFSTISLYQQDGGLKFKKYKHNSKLEHKDEIC